MGEVIDLGAARKRHAERSPVRPRETAHFAVSIAVAMDPLPNRSVDIKISISEVNE